MTKIPRTLLERSAFVFFAAAFFTATATCGSAQTQTKQLQVRPKPAEQAPASATPGIDHAASYYHYGLAKLYESEALQSGRQDLATQAVEQYKMALNADPDSRILANGLANLYFNLGRVREAVASAQAQVQRHPEDVEAHMLLGRTYLRSLGNGQGQQSTEMLHAAIGEYETIAKLKPGDIETHLLLGQLYGLNHDSAKALDQFKLARAIDPDSEETALATARQYSEDGDLKSAAKVLSDVPADERSVRMNFALAGLDEQLKNYVDAAAAYKLVLAADPGNADAKKGLAQALLSSGKSSEAANVYADILKGDPQDPQALIRQGELERTSGKYEDALATFKKAEGLVPDNIEILFNEGLVYDALGRFDESVSSFKQALTASLPPNGQYSDGDKQNRALFLERLANVYREMGKTDDAVAAYKEMGALGGTNASHAAESIVDALRDAHRWKDALNYAADAAKAMPKDRDVQIMYARQLADAGKMDEAVKLTRAQLGGDAASTRETYLALADLYARVKNYKDAQVALDAAEASATDPNDKAFVYYFRGHVADVAKMYDEAEIQFRKGLALTPDSPSIWNDYGYMLADKGERLGEAVDMLKKAVNADPQNGAYLDSLAWAYYKQGQFALAEEYSRKAALRTPADPTVLDHLGEIEAHNGKLQAAVAHWEKSLNEYATLLPPDAEPADVAKVQKKLENARVKLAKLNHESR